MAERKTSIIQLPPNSVKQRLTFSPLGIHWAEGQIIIFLFVHYGFIYEYCYHLEKLSLNLSFSEVHNLSIQDHCLPLHTNSCHHARPQVHILDDAPSLCSSQLHFSKLHLQNVFTLFQELLHCEIFNHEISVTEHSVFLPSTNSIQI